MNIIGEKTMSNTFFFLSGSNSEVNSEVASAMSSSSEG